MLFVSINKVAKPGCIDTFNYPRMSAVLTTNLQHSGLRLYFALPRVCSGTSCGAASKAPIKMRTISMFEDSFLPSSSDTLSSSPFQVVILVHEIAMPMIGGL